MKLSPESEQIVAATAGVVAAHAEQITRTFYPDMFAAHPELMRLVLWHTLECPGELLELEFTSDSNAKKVAALQAALGKPLPPV